MTNRLSRNFLLAILVFFLATPVYSTQIFWAKGSAERTSVLSIFLGDGYEKRKITSPSETFTLIVQKAMIEDDTLRFVWKTNQEIWLAKTKKIPEETSAETVTLPAGKPMDLEIRTAAGKLLATVEFRQP